MSKLTVRRVYLLIIFALLLGLAPNIQTQAQNVLLSPALTPTPSAESPTPTSTPDRGGTLTPTPPPNTTPLPTPIPLTVTPTPVRHLPALDLKLDFSSRFISVGDTIALTITVRNQATDPGENLNVILPVPPEVVVGGGQQAGRAVALPSTTPGASPTASPPASPTPHAPLTWSLSELPPLSSASFTATMRLISLPQGGALLFSPQVTATGLDLPVSKTIGQVVVDHSGGPNSVQYTPGTPVTLHSSDNQVTVDFPAGAYTSPLTLQHSFDPPSGTNPPGPDIHRSFDTFYLTATDQLERTVHQFAQPLTITVNYTPEQLHALNIVEGDLQLSYFDDTAVRWQAVPSTVDMVNHQVTAQVNHFTGFHLKDGSSPSTEFIPSLQG